MASRAFIFPPTFPAERKPTEFGITSQDVTNIMLRIHGDNMIGFSAQIDRTTNPSTVPAPAPAPAAGAVVVAVQGTFFRYQYGG